MNSQTAQDLLAASKRMGADSSLVQGAGGNVSIKDGNTLWVKASGKWLAHAGDEPMLVPLDLARVRRQLADATDDKQPVKDAVLAQDPPIALRPSIETTLHAVMPQNVVFHVHCVRTLAWSVQSDQREEMASLLAGLNWVSVPYARPGLPLTRLIEENARRGEDVLILDNHGLVVGGASVQRAEALLHDVMQRLDRAPRPQIDAKLDILEPLLRGGGYRLPRHPVVHGLATDPDSLAYACKGSLYPDHVVFLGHAVAVLAAGERPRDAVRRIAAAGVPEPGLVLVPGAGVLIREDVGANGEEMALGLALTIARIPPGRKLKVLAPAQELALVDWDAEKYRQTLNA